MSVIGKFASVLVALALVVGVAAGARAADSITVKLEPQSNSGESGTATLTEAGANQTKVVIETTGAPAGVAQPVHIHKGTCDKLDPKPAYPLSNVVNGKSETTVKASLKSLEKDHAINGHKSAQDAKTYVFCGNIAAK